MIRSLILAAELLAATCGGPELPVHSGSFQAALSQVVWAGSSGLRCDLKCRGGCAGDGFSDAAAQREAACAAACGCGGGAGRIVALSEAGTAYTSGDNGTTWQDLRESVSLPSGSAPFRVEQIHVSHADAQLVAAITNSSLWLLSRDGGRSWQAMKLTTPSHGEHTIASWQWHPTVANWVLAESPAWSAREAGVRPGRRPRDALYSQDGGASWRLFASNVAQSRWAVPPHGANASRMLVSRFVPAPQPASSGVLARLARTKPPDNLQDVVVTEDFLNSSAAVVGVASPGGVGAASQVHLHQSFIFALVPEPAGAGLRLWFGDDAPGAQGLRPVAFPPRIGPVLPRQLRHMKVLHSTEHTALLYVAAADPDLPWGHVFSCSRGSPDVELLLTDVHRPSALASVAFEAVQGVDGVFIASRAVLDRGQDLDEAEREYDAQADLLETEEEDGATDVPAAGSQPRRFAVRTYISLNMGLAWQPLQPPSGNSGGWPSEQAFEDCQRTDPNGRRPGSCRLHLASWTSAAAAPGLVLGVGNVGQKLSDEPDHFKVWVSRDAGISWAFALSGMHSVAILSHGDVLVAVPHQSPATLHYSTDSGVHWHAARIYKGPPGLSAAGLFTHPAHTDWRALVALGSDVGPAVQLASVDLSVALPVVCKGAADAGTSASDFEKWSPADAMEDAHESRRTACWLGVRTRYTRRRADRACRTVAQALMLAPRDLRTDAPCPCTSADWTCAPGFRRATYGRGAPCEPAEAQDAPNVSSLCAGTAEEEVLVSRGYVRLAGNGCQGGVDLSPRAEACAANAGVAGALRRLLAAWRATGLWVAAGAAAVLVGAAWLQQRQRGKGAGGARGAAGASQRLASVIGRSAAWREYGLARTPCDEEDDEERELLIGER
ncbi:unnamed protein product [Prorocentrum cordatum]|uniref:VPS10 domain-containing protein n=1 Tax=Prorocentrum cordatum TaxID=2364126 RepID=A0ABN9X1V9_9DINO|nr:unnamed protein product [Polarella glacialis]